MSTFLTTAQAMFAPAFDVSLSSAVLAVTGTLLLIGLLKLFRPLLTGVARALVLVVKPKLSKEQKRALQQLHNTKMLNKMLVSMDGAATSQAAELRALAARP